MSHRILLSCVVCCSLHSKHRSHVCSPHKTLVRLGRVSPRVWRLLGKTIGFDGNVDNILIKSRIVLTSAAPRDWRPAFYPISPAASDCQIAAPTAGHTRRTLAGRQNQRCQCAGFHNIWIWRTIGALGCLSVNIFSDGRFVCLPKILTDPHYLSVSIDSSE